MSPKLNMWVDVGGTFTDAILWSEATEGKESTYQSLKVLSSGRIRCTLWVYPDQLKLAINGLPKSCRDFWVSSSIAIALPNAPTVYGTIVASDDHWLELDIVPPEILRWNSAKAPLSAEISCGLESPILAAHLLLDIPVKSPLPPINVRLGTTRGTNALLTRTGADVGLCITEGFGDIPYIGNQDRPDLFALNVVKTPPLCRKIVEVHERIDAQGNVLVPLNTKGLRETFAAWKTEGIRSIAIVLMHSYQMPEHEAQVAAIAREFAFDEIICSSCISPVRKLLSRCDTTLVDAYLSPVINDYLRLVQKQLGHLGLSNLQIMTSAGSLVNAAEFRGKDSVLSGPAGGIVAVQELLKQTHCKAALAFDMGGTSTDVSRCTQEELPLQYDTLKAGIRIVTPILAIHTVAAGGGSICSFDGVQLHVGPASAGSHPGPACYGQGGPLTITDINLLLGIIPENALPFPVDRKAAEAQLRNIAERICRAQGISLVDLDIASGFRQLANQVMADAIGVISTRQGADPREHVLIGFGGAAGQHQCDLAESLEMSEIIDPPLAGLFSAVGIGFARHRRYATVPLYRPWNEHFESQCQALLETPSKALMAELERLGYSHESITLRTHLEMRYQGTDATLLVPITQNMASLDLAFHQTHQRFFGYQQPQRTIEICTARLEATGPSVATQKENRNRTRDNSTSVPAHRVWHQGAWIDCPIVHRDQLTTGESLNGPAIVINNGHTTWIAPYWQANVDNHQNLRLQRIGPKNPLLNTNKSNDSDNKYVDPIFRDLIGQRLATVALSMGEILEKTAISVNIKERRDFSCAVFDANGYLIANAPHVPVHLGAMGQTVRELLREFPDLLPNDCLLTNDPNRGGSHLPDITVVTPVFDPVTAERLFFVACRAHHAEIGGVTSGSMPPMATSLEEEGVLLPPQFLIRHNESKMEIVMSQLQQAKYPSRSPHENVADLLAQQAANHYGAKELMELVQKFGKQRLQSALAQIMDASEKRVRQWVDSLPANTLQFADQLDDGSRIQVSITKQTSPITGDSILRVDFSGTSPPHPRNFNANQAIVTAALLYVIRTLAGDDLPLNEGALRPIELYIPRSLLSPVQISDLRSTPTSQLPAVAAGNVETSQRVVDVLLGALGVAAASQGTMNNFLFGDSSFGYYETICGGTGATASGNGCDAVHSHMTNTRITDPEVLEVRYPVRLREFSIRRNSGGAGEFHGGNGVIRELEFLRPMQASLITSRRTGPPPYGLLGGEAGKRGDNQWIRADGTVESLGGTAQIALQPGDRIRIETPGGGGFGQVSS
jgi:5-oxoprolinase (ATP-hydrolysing)